MCTGVVFSTTSSCPSFSSTLLLAGFATLDDFNVILICCFGGGGCSTDGKGGVLGGAATFIFVGAICAGLVVVFLSVTLSSAFLLLCLLPNPRLLCCCGDLDLDLDDFDEVDLDERLFRLLLLEDGLCAEEDPFSNASAALVYVVGFIDASLLSVVVPGSFLIFLTSEEEEDAKLASLFCKGAVPLLLLLLLLLDGLEGEGLSLVDLRRLLGMPSGELDLDFDLDLWSDLDLEDLEEAELERLRSRRRPPPPPPLR